MTTIDAGMSLGALVTARPELARELERRGLDYCCGGAATLAEACAVKGLDPDAVLAELAATSTDTVATDWTTMDTVDLVDHLERTHHRYLWAELPHLSAVLDKLVDVHGARHPELAEIARCFAEIRADLEPHLLKEERVLFPMIRQLALADASATSRCGTMRNPIAVMQHEHEVLGDLLARLCRLANGYRPPADGCATYTAGFAGLADLEADTHLHIHKENNVLFPLVVRLEAALTRRTEE